MLNTPCSDTYNTSRSEHLLIIVLRTLMTTLNRTYLQVPTTSEWGDIEESTPGPEKETDTSPWLQQEPLNAAVKVAAINVLLKSCNGNTATLRDEYDGKTTNERAN